MYKHRTLWRYGISLGHDQWASIHSEFSIVRRLNPRLFRNRHLRDDQYCYIRSSAI